MAFVGLLALIALAWIVGLVDFIIKVIRTLIGKTVPSQATLPVLTSQPGFLFWLAWTLLTALASTAGLYATYIAAGIFGLDPFTSDRLLDALQAMPVLGAGLGAFMGSLQYFLLRRRLSRPQRWIFATMAGWSLGLGLGGSAASITHSPAIQLLAALFVGAAVGSTQWLVLRRAFRRANYWLLVTILSWTVAIALGVALGVRIGMPHEGDTSPMLVVPWTVGGIIGSVGGTLTATSMVWLLRSYQAPAA